MPNLAHLPFKSIKNLNCNMLSGKKEISIGFASKIRCGLHVFGVEIILRNCVRFILKYCGIQTFARMINNNCFIQISVALIKCTELYKTKVTSVKY